MSYTPTQRHPFAIASRAQRGVAIPAESERHLSLRTTPCAARQSPPGADATRPPQAGWMVVPLQASLPLL